MTLENFGSNKYVGSTYCMDKVNQTIELWKGRITLQASNFELIGLGSVYLEWLTTPALKFRLENMHYENSGDSVNKACHSSDEILSIIFEDSSISSSCCFITIFSLNTGVIEGIITKKINRNLSDNPSPKSMRFSNIIYSVCNFTHKNLYNSRMHGRRGHLKYEVLYKNLHHNAARLTLEYRQYCWTIDYSFVLAKSNSVHKKSLVKTGGYAITHHARLYHKSKKLSREDAFPQAEALTLFLSFIQGYWVSLILPVGFDENNCRLWEQWEQPSRTTSYKSFMLCSYDLSSLNDLYCGFMEKLNNPRWTYGIKRAIIWYIDSISTVGNTEGLIVWIHSAMELLSYIYLVKEQHMSKSNFKRNGFIRNLSVLTKELKISVDVDQYFPSIKSRKSRYFQSIQPPDSDVEEGIFLFSKARNDVVHPEEKIGFTTDSMQLKCEFLDLGRWYLEMILVRFFGDMNFASDRLHQWKEFKADTF